MLLGQPAEFGSLFRFEKQQQDFRLFEMKRLLHDWEKDSPTPLRFAYSDANLKRV